MLVHDDQYDDSAFDVHDLDRATAERLLEEILSSMSAAELMQVCSAKGINLIDEFGREILEAYDEEELDAARVQELSDQQKEATYYDTLPY